MKHSTAVPTANPKPITTSSAGLKAGFIDVPVAGESLPAFYAMPDALGRFPVVLVIQEIFGVHEHIQDVCRRFAQAGFLAIAPQLYWRQGDPTAEPDVPAIIQNIVSKVPDEQVMADLDACLVWAGLHGGNLAKVAATGFCWGGRITWLYAAHQPMLSSAVAWYGRLTVGHGPLNLKHPIDLTHELKAPVLGLYGALDAGIPLADVNAMQKALKGGNDRARASEVRVYEEADHGFFADYRLMYNAVAAKDAWQRCLAWIRLHQA
jgi:carboxymethylenebutenolidase